MAIIDFIKENKGLLMLIAVLVLIGVLCVIGAFKCFAEFEIRPGLFLLGCAAVITLIILGIIGGMKLFMF